MEKTGNLSPMLFFSVAITAVNLSLLDSSSSSRDERFDLSRLARLDFDKCLWLDVLGQRTLFDSPSSNTPASIRLPFLSCGQEYPCTQRGSLPVCLSQAWIWVTEQLSSDVSASRTKRHTNTDNLSEHVCVDALKHGVCPPRSEHERLPL